MSLIKKLIGTILSLLLMITMLPEQVLLNSRIDGKVSAAEDNIVYYKNVVFSPKGDYQGDGRGILTFSAPPVTLTNVQYNKTTGRFTFDIKPDGATVQTYMAIPNYADGYNNQEGSIGRSFSTMLTLNFNLYGDGWDQYPWLSVRKMLWTDGSGTVPNHYPLEKNHGFNLGVDTPRSDIYDPGYRNKDVQFISLDYTFRSTQYIFIPDLDTSKFSKYLSTFSEKVPLIPNEFPNLSVITPDNQLLINHTGLSGMAIEGYANDPDNEDVTVTAEIPNVFYKKIVLPQALTAKYFSIPIDAIDDSLAPGNYTMTITASDPSGLKKTATLHLSVKARMRNKAFTLINTPIETKTKFMDYEGDSKIAERFRYDHDPYFFDNSMGIIPDSGLWRSAAYLSFPYTGVYTATFQGRDNPKDDNQFDIYRKWSRDNLSSMTFHVHRKPIALFSAKLVGESLQLTDFSYDLDHITASNKGLITWQWQYKKTNAGNWIDGQPPSQLPSKDQYDIRLRVRDVDGENGVGVWSDWYLQTVGAASNLPPVALFTVEPIVVSYRSATTIFDRSFDPDNDPLDLYYWTVIKDGVQVWSHWGGATVPPNITSFGLGNYQINLQVHDNRGLWSDWYSQSVQVINHPPAAAFNMPPEVYRDTIITLENTTPAPDEDGDSLAYGWYARLNSSPYYYAGSNRNQSMTIGDLIARSGISPRQAISDGWEMRLNAVDIPVSSNVTPLTSYATRLFTVKNHVPTAGIDGPDAVYQYDTITYYGVDSDEDPSDMSSLQYYWKVTDSDGTTKMFRTANINVDFAETGVYTIEHWVVDQIGDKSNIAMLKVNVAKNQPPVLTLIAPTGTATNPSIIDAELEGDPLIKWTYADPENDRQEKYRLEFFSKDGLLTQSVENSDNTGLLRQYQIPNHTFHRFEYFTVYGRAYSKLSWSEISNEKTFIIDNPPSPGFTLV